MLMSKLIGFCFLINSVKFKIYDVNPSFQLTDDFFHLNLQLE